MIESICKEHGVKLHVVQAGDEYCVANGEDTYVNSSYSAGDVDCSPEIWLGIYDDEELKKISFFHELGHVLDSGKVYLHRYSREMRAWEIGLSYAQHIMKIEFSENAIAWAMKQLETYRED